MQSRATKNFQESFSDSTQESLTPTEYGLDHNHEQSPHLPSNGEVCGALSPLSHQIHDSPSTLSSSPSPRTTSSRRLIEDAGSHMPSSTDRISNHEKALTAPSRRAFEGTLFKVLQKSNKSVDQPSVIVDFPNGN